MIYNNFNKIQHLPVISFQYKNLDRYQNSLFNYYKKVSFFIKCFFSNLAIT